MIQVHRSVLLIAFHYPPCATSSGVQRALSFSIHLRQHGWRVVVLTVAPQAHERTNPHQLKDIPHDVPVYRTLALDAARHLSIKGRYWSRLAIPDRWMSWRLSAVPRALHLIRRHGINAVWSTYPIATAHSIAGTVVRVSGLPWVADFRDPMVEYVPATGAISPSDPNVRAARLSIERTVMQRAYGAVFCTEGARRIVSDRYPDLGRLNLRVIPNGFEEGAFSDAESLIPTAASVSRRKVLLHSGIVYPGPDRDPTALFQAIRSLANEQIIAPADFELRFRDPANEAYFHRLAADIGVSEFVTIAPALPYREALAEMMCVDALLLLQGYTSNPAVPAKLYEYLRARRPILALVHPEGESAATLRKVGVDTMAPLTDGPSIRELLLTWLTRGEQLEANLPSMETVAAYSRERQTSQFAQLLDEAVAARRIRNG